MAYDLAKDPTAHYFAGPWAQLAPLAPCFAVAGHMAHVHAGKLSVVPAVIAMIPGPLVLAITANAYVRSTLGNLPEMLSSNDCAWYDVKEKPELSWQLAERIHTDCLADHELQFPDAERLFKMQECPTYLQHHKSSPMPSFQDGLWHALLGPNREMNFTFAGILDDYAEHRVTWRYFESLEVEQQCSGWCQPERPLWTTRKTKDSCSSVAGHIMKYKIQPLAYSMLAYSTALIVMALVSIALLVAYGKMKA